MPAGPSDVMWHVSLLCTLIGTFSPQQRPVTLSATLSLQSFDFFSFSLRFPSSSYHFLSLHSVAASSVCVCVLWFLWTNLPLLWGENYRWLFIYFCNQVARFLLFCCWFCCFLSYPFPVFPNCMQSFCFRVLGFMDKAGSLSLR